MAKYQVFKETALPGTLQPHSIYLVAPAGTPDYVEIYVTGALASTVKRVIKQSDIQSMIDTSIGAVNSTIFVNDIAARDALVLTKNAIVLVLDASADVTVGSGAATYAYRHSDTSWTKIAEAESMDLIIDWSNIQNKPASAVADIDDAVSKRHTHANMTSLNKIGESGGEMTYDGQPVATQWGSTEW